MCPEDSYAFNVSPLCFFFFFLNDTAPPEIYTLPLHAALPISGLHRQARRRGGRGAAKVRSPRVGHNRPGDRRIRLGRKPAGPSRSQPEWPAGFRPSPVRPDPESTRLKSSPRLNSDVRLLLEKK